MDRRRTGAGRANGGIAAFTAILVLTVTCAAAIHKAAAAGDVASVAFVAVSYGAVLLLHRTLGAYETAAGAPDEGAAAAEPERERLRRRVWALSALLTALFAWKVAGVVPWPAGVLVWAATSSGGFFALVARRRP
ncbi:unnamed protein product [Miscanthus lutarioriparius]|uniref:Uncharacterized protein n=1 Tax=Miscanthus lutarioriparius TaxID=422564 RepID=A0A811SKR7_9POAL|nr:unnamed protein product [Miscanthus lutarioriparius]